jgi:hypothetical protein
MTTISHSSSTTQDCPRCKGGCQSCKNTDKIACFKHELRVWRDGETIIISDREGRFEPLSIEEWLNQLTDALRPVFDEIGHQLPEKLRVSCGWPSRKALGKKRALGQSWYPQNSADQHTEVFISPFEGNTERAAETLAHELEHAAGCHGHGKEFVKVAGALGFQKPWKSTPPTPELTERLAQLCAPLGPYPHATLDSAAKEASGGDNPDKNRWLKATCQGCGYVCRTSKKWLQERGARICPCSMLPMFADVPNGEEEPEGELEEAA